MLSDIKKVFYYFQDFNKYRQFEFNYKDEKRLLLKQKSIQYDKKRILAVYDFIDMPYTCDVSNFVIKAEIERRRLNLEKIDLLFITNSEYPLNERFQEFVSKENYQHLIYNIALEFTRLFNTIGSFFVVDNRNQSMDFIKSMKDKYYLYPKDYNVKLPFERVMGTNREMSFYLTDYYLFAQKDPSINFLRPPQDQLRLVRKWIMKNIYPKIPITITLRETKADPGRGSNIEEYQKFINTYSNQEEYVFIILRDYYNLYDEDVLKGSNVIYCNEAVLSLSFRAALYQESSLNLLNTNGVGMLCWYNTQTRYLMFKMLNNKSRVTQADFMKAHLNIEPGDNWHGSTKYQKLVWQSDDAEILEKETSQMIKILKKDNLLYPKFYDKGYMPQKDNITIHKEVYNQKSVMSQRIPLHYYVFVYHIMKFLQFIFPNIYYKSLYQIKVKKSTTILLYGAGTVAQNIILQYKKNIIGIVDQNYENLEVKNIDTIPIFPIERVDAKDYDYLVITPKNRELMIISTLRNQYNLPKKKFIIASSYN